MIKQASTRSFFTDVVPVFLAVIVLIVLAMPFSCSFKEPVAPQWDVNLVVPLMNRAITMKELVDDNDDLMIGSDSLVSLDITEKLDRFEVGDALKVAGIRNNFHSELGKFSVAAPGSRQANLTLGQIYPSAYMVDGQTVPVAAFSFDNVTTPLASFTNFSSILVESGFVRITVTNSLPVPIAAGLELQVRNQITEATVFIARFPNAIASQATAEQTINLRGITIPAALKLVAFGSSPGSNGASVPIRVNSNYLAIDTYISDITAVQATATIEDQEFTGADSLALGDSIIVSQAVIASGMFNFDVKNNIPLDLNLALELNDFYDAYDRPMVVNIPIPAGQRSLRVINVSGYSFRPAHSSEGSAVHFSWSVLSEGSHGNLVTLASTDDLTLSVELSSLTFTEMHGVLQNVHVQLDSLREDFDMPDGMNDLRFKSARLELIVNNGIGFPIYPNIKIVGANDVTGRVVELPVSQRIEPANGHPTQSTIVLDQNNSRIIDLLNVSPNMLQVTGSVLLGDGVTEAVIRNTDFIESSVRIMVPLSLSFPAQSVKTEIDTIEIDEDAQKELQKNLLSGKVYAKINNHLPLGCQVTLHFSSLDTNVYVQPQLTIGPLTLEPAPVAAGSGRVTQESESEISIELTQEQFALFGHENVFMGVSATIPGSNGQSYKIYANDYIGVHAYGEFKYHVDPEDQSK